jgi:NAD-dependent dihydropyrimidine dehydrogenase PreA subunit
VTYVITGACIESMDRSCIEVCPVDCIYEAGRMFVIHPGECIDCGACLPECPVEAIYVEDDVPASDRAFVAVNAAIERGVGDVDTAVQAVLAESSGRSARR